MKRKIENGDKCWIGGTCLIRNTDIHRGWFFDGSEDDMYFNGYRVEYDEEDGYYIEI